MEKQKKVNASGTNSYELLRKEKELIQLKKSKNKRKRIEELQDLINHPEAIRILPEVPQSLFQGRTINSSELGDTIVDESGFDILHQ